MSRIVGLTLNLMVLNWLACVNSVCCLLLQPSSLEWTTIVQIAGYQIWVEGTWEHCPGFRMCSAYESPECSGCSGWVLWLAWYRPASVPFTTLFLKIISIPYYSMITCTLCTLICAVYFKLLYVAQNTEIYCSSQV